MLVLVDAAADAVLLAIDAALLALGEMAVVFRHVRLFALLNARFALFKIGRFLRSQRAVFHAIANALLLVFLTLVDFIDARMTRIDNAGPCAGGG